MPLVIPHIEGLTRQQDIEVYKYRIAKQCLRLARAKNLRVLPNTSPAKLIKEYSLWEIERAYQIILGK